MTTAAGTAYLVGSGAAIVFRRHEITAEINWNQDDLHHQPAHDTRRGTSRRRGGPPSQVTKLTLT
jgi:hypothetical protein